MKEMYYKKLYDALLENDELRIALPNAKGCWEEDSKSFIRAQKEMEDIINLKDVIDAEDIN